MEYLVALEQAGTRGYELLLGRNDGSIALAAHELATWKLRAIGTGGPPTGRDLRVAAKEIEARGVWTASGLIPKAHILASECRAAGRAVIDT